MSPASLQPATLKDRIAPADKSAINLNPAPQSSFVRMRPVDFAALLVGAFEIPSFLFSQYPANGLHSSQSITIAVLAYLVVRLMIQRSTQMAALAALIGIAGAFISVMGIHHFFVDTGGLAAAGFSDFLAFRSNLMRPLSGWLPGESFTLLLLVLPFAFVLVIYSLLTGSRSLPMKALGVMAMIATAIIATGLCFSLSRAAFWGMILMFLVSSSLMVAYRIVSLKTGTALLCGTLVAIVLLLSCASIAYTGIFKAYIRSETSQTRSTHGRLDIWSRSVEVVRAHPWFGVGSSNSALFLLSTVDPQDTTGFASRPFSLPIQILIEKGIVGFTLYVAFLVLVGIEFHRSMRSNTLSEVEDRRVSKKALRERDQRDREQAARKAMQCCFAAGLIAVIFRELTYSSLFEHTLTVILAFILAALACGRRGATA